MNAGMKRILAVLSVISCSAAAILSPAEHVLAQDYTAGTSPADADISGQQPYTPVPENPAWQLPVNEAISGGQESADGSYPGQALDSSQPEAEPDESTDVPDEETIQPALQKTEHLQKSAGKKREPGRFLPIWYSAAPAGTGSIKRLHAWRQEKAIPTRQSQAQSTSITG